ncbi:hypothetical protein Tco_1075106 [Tanacetum coccineum]
MYVMTCTRPDIAFVVGKLSRYTSNPGTQHWQAIQMVLKYLIKPWTIDCIPAWWWLPISWAIPKKQNCKHGLSMESEFVALTAACAATLAKAYSQMYNGKSRDLGVRHSMIRELITNGVVSIEFVRSQQNLADHLTKGLARDLVLKSAEGMGLKTEAHVLHIIPGMCLKRADKEDEVANFSMVNFFEKVLSRSMNKEEPPMDLLIPVSGDGAEGYHQRVIHQRKYPQRVSSSEVVSVLNLQRALGSNSLLWKVITRFQVISDNHLSVGLFSSKENGYTIVSWALSLRQEGRQAEILSTRLWEAGPADVLVELLHLGLLCTADSVVQRPFMRQVKCKLRRIRPAEADC